MPEGGGGRGEEGRGGRGRRGEGGGGERGRGKRGEGGGRGKGGGRDKRNIGMQLLLQSLVLKITGDSFLRVWYHVFPNSFSK